MTITDTLSTQLEMSKDKPVLWEAHEILAVSSPRSQRFFKGRPLTRESGFISVQSILKSEVLC